ncbi:hypothetical protein P171DRAFT_436482 [Karstenula rhodostoma CBS 690.94]|uniref:Uncharacterized protein n=1 Tax=Karstenula rhodostoma CBS 690.94 TaxID=1392251 RepID=A0A9P4U5K2_9PLEO|nr:hypothetical protein P171DRAFT_436482 [Karstenula rhodostoma CBS 690.94]
MGQDGLSENTDMIACAVTNEFYCTSTIVPRTQDNIQCPRTINRQLLPWLILQTAATRLFLHLPRIIKSSKRFAQLSIIQPAADNRMVETSQNMLIEHSKLGEETKTTEVLVTVVTGAVYVRTNDRQVTRVVKPTKILAGETLFWSAPCSYNEVPP